MEHRDEDGRFRQTGRQPGSRTARQRRTALAAAAAILLGLGLGSTPAAAAPGDLVLKPLGRIYASDGKLEDRFGSALAVVSTAGTDRLVVGASWSDCPGKVNCGQAYLFQRSSTVAGFAQTEMFIHSPLTSYDAFGQAVALDKAATTLVISMPEFDYDSNKYLAGKGGKVMTLMKSASGYTLDKTVVPTAGTLTDDRFGVGLALSGDGNWLVVGAPGRDNPGDGGEVYVFHRESGGWTEQATLRPLVSPAAFDHLGNAVAINQTGDTLVAGADGTDCTAGADCGKVYLFTRDTSNTWTKAAELTQQGALADDRFGIAVAMDDAGQTVAVGANGRHAPGVSAGAVYIFAKPASGWADAVGAPLPLKAGMGPASYDYLGAQVALSGDGKTLAAGAQGTDCASCPYGSPCNDCGKLYLFKKDSAGSWSHKLAYQPPYPHVKKTDKFGWAVALNETGDLCAVGAPFDDAGAVNAGAVHIFSILLDDGSACTTAAQCSSGSCVDGVCCDTACGGSLTSDCQACSVAAGASADGVCTVLPSSKTCRAAGAGPLADIECDLPESCDGTTTSCPPDQYKPGGTICSAGTCNNGVCTAAPDGGAPDAGPAGPDAMAGPDMAGSDGPVAADSTAGSDGPAAGDAAPPADQQIAAQDGAAGADAGQGCPLTCDECDEGCSCRVGRGSSHDAGSAGALGLALLLIAVTTRRRRQRAAQSPRTRSRGAGAGFERS